MRKVAICRIGLFLLLSSSALAQKQTVFTWGDPTPRVSAFSRIGCFGACWQAQDFAWTMANPNVLSRPTPDTVNGPLWLRVTLIADDPNFQYVCDLPSGPCCVNRTVDGKCIGTYQYADSYVLDYTQTQPGVGLAGTALFFVIPAPSGTTVTWTGIVRMESVQGPWRDNPTVTVNVQPFYSWDPRQFTSPMGTSSPPSDPCAPTKAFQNGWQSFDANNVSVSWDGDIQRHVIPYANYWHYRECWPRGWQTTVTITNGTGQDVTYTLENHLWSGVHGHTAGQPACPGSATNTLCKDCNEGEIETATPVPNTQTSVIDIATKLTFDQLLATWYMSQGFPTGSATAEPPSSAFALTLFHQEASQLDHADTIRA